MSEYADEVEEEYEPPPPEPGYFSLSRTPTYGFLGAVPLLIAYECLIVATNTDRAVAVRVGADLWTKQLLAATGATAHLTFGACAFVLGLVIFVLDRKAKARIRLRYFAFMLAESMVYAVVVATVVSNLVARILHLPVGAAVLPMAASVMEEKGQLPLQLALSLGAGLYEELIFRVLLIWVLFTPTRIFLPKFMGYSAAAVIAALTFSAVHFIGPMPTAASLSAFLFLFFFGLALNAIYLARGFAIAAWTHALYDIMVVMMRG
jgi:membrane protease YdiL (CAAX protease family)